MPADYRLYFGGDVLYLKPWGWTTLSLQSVQIDYADGPRPEWLSSIVKRQSEPLIAPSPVQPSILAGKSVESIPVTSNAAIALSALSINYVDKINGTQARGFLSKVLGVWIITVELINRTDKPIWILPGTLDFNNKAYEDMYSRLAWQSYTASRNIGGGRYGADVPEIPITVTYSSPVPKLASLIYLKPGQPTTIDLYAENGGGWRYVTYKTVHGSTSGPEAIERNPISLNLLCIQDPEAVQKMLDLAFLAQPIPQIVPDTLGRCHALNQVRAQLKPPPIKDPRWINIPITKETLGIYKKNLDKQTKGIF